MCGSDNAIFGIFANQQLSYWIAEKLYLKIDCVTPHDKQMPLPNSSLHSDKQKVDQEKGGFIKPDNLPLDPSIYVFFFRIVHKYVEMFITNVNNF